MMRIAAICLIAATLAGCSSERQASNASLETSLSVTDVVAGPISETDLTTVIDIVESIPEPRRPKFQPALEPIDHSGLRSVDVLSAVRRNYMAALEVGSQAEGWSKNDELVAACRERGLSVGDLAVLLTRIGCAHHASESGSEIDVATARSSGETKIAQLLPQIDAAHDELQRQTLIESLESIVAFDAYLTLLDLVPEANRMLVTKHRPCLTAILPPTPQMTIEPTGAVDRVSSNRSNTQ